MPQNVGSALSLSRQRVGVLSYVMMVQRGTASLADSHLLYIPDRWEGGHPLGMGRVQRTVHVRGAERTGHGQRADRARVTVH